MAWSATGANIRGPQGDTGPAGGAADIASETTGSDAKTTPVDNDVVPLVDSESSFGLKKISWSNLKAALVIPELSSYSAVIGNGVSTSITVTHNLNTRNVVVSVKKASDYVEVDCDVAATTLDTVTLTFATAPTANQYVVTVVGDSLVTPTSVAVLDGGTATGSTEDIIDGGAA